MRVHRGVVRELYPLERSGPRIERGEGSTAESSLFGGDGYPPVVLRTAIVTTETGSTPIALSAVLACFARSDPRSRRAIWCAPTFSGDYKRGPTASIREQSEWLPAEADKVREDGPFSVDFWAQRGTEVPIEVVRDGEAVS